jgi:hypothetical protein
VFNIYKALAELKRKALKTDFPKWRRLLSASVFAFLCASTVAIFWYLYLTMGELHCYRGFVIFTIPWLVAELLVIRFLYHSQAIPQYVRDSIGLIIAFSNIWFGLLVFSLKTCA